MFHLIRTSKATKVIALFLAQLLILEIIYPARAFALTGGPSQPEVQGFEPVGTTDMVDLFTGDFSYNIPLIDVGGYPINMSYHSGASMDQEASWVGLGWNINPGVINRDMRALPDDFEGDPVVKEFNINKNESFGVNTGVGFELFGLDFLKIEASLGLSYNNYTGYGTEMGIEPSISASKSGTGCMTMSLGLSASSESGVSVKPRVSFLAGKYYMDKTDETGVGGNIGLGYNSRSGLSSLSLGFYGAKWDKSGTAKDRGRYCASGINSDISFAYPTYTPTIDMPMINSNISLSVTLGSEIFGGHINGRVSGYYSCQKLQDKTMTSSAFGYMNLEKAGKNSIEIAANSLDFNREKDGSFTPHKPNLPIPNLTYDIYTVSGQGIGGTYRPYRSDYGVIYDRRVSNLADGISLGGIEIGGGNGVHGGLNLTVNSTVTDCGKWQEQNNLNSMSFKSIADVTNKYFEPFYFKKVGEKTTENSVDFYEGFGNSLPVKVKLENEGDKTFARTSLINSNNDIIKLPQDNFRHNRARRNEAITAMKADEAQNYGLEKQIKNYATNAFLLGSNGSYSHNNIIRNTNYRKGHHISEITAFREDGARYVYGIPAYNIKREDVTFAISGKTPIYSTGLVSYTNGQENSVKNTCGLDNYFSKTTLPGYAHSYLLTAILSPDYVDVTLDGPTDDDMGNYTKINYSLVDDNYKWRVPYEKEMANYDEGFKSKNDNSYGDDKANYIYGEKELWYIHSIETKTQVAEFVLADRCDGYEVESDAGGIGQSSTKKLIRIDLYSKRDRMVNGANATPIKSVHFEYDYSLCPDIPNNRKDQTDKDETGNNPTGFVNQGGKLTLKKVYFTYQKSKKGMLNPYVFDYSQIHTINNEKVVTVNPGYNLKGYDRWGNFMPNTSTTGQITDPLTNPEFPYTTQKRIAKEGEYNTLYEEDNPKWIADVYATAWNLTSIALPSGGIIHVDYESDDYAYVQNKRAMQMFKVIGAGNSPDMSAMVNELYGGENNNTNNNYLFFEFENPVTDQSKANFKRSFLTNEKGVTLEYLYFKYLLKLDEAKGAWEFVPGYVKMKNIIPETDYGFIDNNHGYIKIDEVLINDEVPKDRKVNPISQAGWNFEKLYLPKLAYGGATPSKDIMEVFQAIASMFDQIGSTIGGLCNYLRKNSSSKTFMPQKSWIRLYAANDMKKGGGSRVKKIVLNDQWKELTGYSNYSSSEYGQEYTYTTHENGKTISSGVAAYEPILGGDENPFKEPVCYEEKNLLVANDDYYMEKPFGESFFPGASVGYSRVTVKNLQHKNVEKNATGSVVYEYYTAKDFPTITQYTTVDPQRKVNRGALKLLNIESHDYMTASQGYMVELNDMHGKMRSQKTYPENSDKPIAEATYYYKTLNGKLNNDVDVISKDGKITSETIGMDYDFVVDMREQKTETQINGFNGNLDFFMAWIFPVVVPMVYPKYAHEENRFRSAVTTKIINRYALLDYVVNIDNGSQTTTYNRLYDSETGQVLLTETQNQFSDPLYSFTYPAHWAYDGMGPAYKNLGIITSGGNDLVEGDEVAFDNSYGWVTAVKGGVKVMNNKGEYYENPTDMQVIRSGRRNQAAMALASVVSLNNPVVTTPDGKRLKFNKVLNASASEFTNKAGVFCGECGIEPGSIYNPYVVGQTGNWRAYKTYAYLTDRIQSRANNNTNIRTDGIYKDFEPFWTPNNGKDWKKNNSTPHWTCASEVTIFSPYGVAFESRDALGLYSSSVYGYNQLLPVAMAANARYKEIGFEGFEDWDFTTCSKNHFSYEEVAKNVSNNPVSDVESHTGRKSFKISGINKIEVRKILVPCEEAE
jgi:hypothetical protein